MEEFDTSGDGVHDPLSPRLLTRRFGDLGDFRAGGHCRSPEQLCCCRVTWNKLRKIPEFRGLHHRRSSRGIYSRCNRGVVRLPANVVAAVVSGSNCRVFLKGTRALHPVDCPSKRLLLTINWLTKETRMTKKAANAEQAVQIAAGKSIEASLQNTFAVGGILVDNRTGRVFCALHNNVLEAFENSKVFLLHDPTAHGERQIVDWYFKNRKRLKLPHPRQLTVVTTLDPCAMCAGALLTAGFN